MELCRYGDGWLERGDAGPERFDESDGRLGLGFGLGVLLSEVRVRVRVSGGSGQG